MRRKGRKDWGWVPVTVVKKKFEVVFDDKATEAIKELEQALTAGGWPPTKLAAGTKLEPIDPDLLLELKRVTYKPEHIKLWKAKHGKKDKNDS